MNFYIEFVPAGQNVYRLPIRAVDKFEAERIAFELATILHAEKSGWSNGSTGYSTDDLYFSVEYE